ncbi:MAG: squalene/phytoene synthase family protein [Thermoanaerobaculia bacterium]
MANLDDLLEKTSRTFALSIPLLPEPTRREVSIAYLLFRIADTFEDAELWSPAERRKALSDFAALLDMSSEAGGGVRGADASAKAGLRAPRESELRPRSERDLPSGRSGRTPTPASEAEGAGAFTSPAHGRSSEAEALAAAWTARPPCAHEGYLELLRETPSVLRDFESLAAPARVLIGEHVRRSAGGMAGFVSRMTAQGNLVLDDVADLRGYCYAVAGIVGEMLTELFLLGGGLSGIEAFLRKRAPLFGEGLQLVNILKDSYSDLEQGRRYLPPGVDRAEVFALARNDLARAGEYVLELQKAGAPRGLVGFTALPVELAWASLDRIEKAGAGAKVSRPEVFLIARRLERALDRNEPAIFSISCGGGAS